MYLERLEIQGFKSFADKTVLKFDRGNTAVVGPNGSGKSNVADAVRWVLGEQSLKMLRGKKSEDVIFAGSGARPQMSMASVSLHLNNEDKKMAIDFPQVVITRKVYRNGESEYLINDSQVRLLDIIELLAKSGFGQKTYSVIGQGMIDVFINSSPSERKLLFEEAAGVKQYQMKRNQTLRKLDLTKQNLGRVRDLLNELRPRLKSLERQTKRASERDALQKELLELQTKWFSYFHSDIKMQLKTINSKYIEAEGAYKQMEKDYQELEKKLREASDSAGGDRKKYEELQNQLETEQRKKNELEGELARLSGLIEVEKGRDYSQDQKTLSQQLGLLEKESGGLKSQLQEVEAERDRAKKLYEEKHLEMDDINEKLAVLRDKMQKFDKGQTVEASTPHIEMELREISRAIAGLIKEIDSVKDIAQLHDIKEFAKDIDERVQGLKTSLEGGANASSQEILSAQKELNALLELKEHKSADATEAHIKLRTCEARLENLSSRLATVQSEIEHTKEKLETGTKPKTDDGNISYLIKKKEGIETEVTALNEKVVDTRNALRSLDQEELERKKGFIEIEKSLRARREALTNATREKNQLEVEKARLEVKKEDLEREITEDIGFDKLRVITPEEKQEMDAMGEEEKNKQRAHMEHLQVQLTKIGGIDDDVIAEHKEVSERYTFLSTQSEDLDKASGDLRKVIEELDKTIKKKFNEAFSKINNEFDKFFKILFNGGTAKLSLVRPEKKKAAEGEEGETEEVAEETDLDQEDPTLKQSIEGVEIKANPPGKKLKNLSMLSGGEKAMTSIALLCAIIANNPSPFVVLDEVDAALDDANARRFARIIGTLDGTTQFIVITHNHETMRMAQILYGITMQRDGVSKMLSIKLEDVKEGGRIEGQESVVKK